MHVSVLGVRPERVTFNRIRKNDILIKSLLDIKWLHYAHASKQTSRMRTSCILYIIESLQRHL